MHEAWIRLATWRHDHPLSESEYQLLASHVMRRILTDHARRRGTAKRDAARRASGVGVEGLATEGSAVVADVDEALDELAALDEELAQVVELRFFGGHTLPEIARTRDLSLSTVNRRWKLARAWLLERLGETGGPR